MGYHETHCCVLHGCKYRDDDCPVVNRRTRQQFCCESCHDECLDSIPDPDWLDYDVLLQRNEILLRKEIIRLRNGIRDHKDGIINNSALYAILQESYKP